jgi:hypothetical protein
MSDVDVLWLADPLPFFASYPKVDFFVSLDTVLSENPAGDAGLERRVWMGRNQNTGVWLARATAGGEGGSEVEGWRGGQIAMGSAKLTTQPTNNRSVRTPPVLRFMSDWRANRTHALSDQESFNALLLESDRREGEARGAGAYDVAPSFEGWDVNHTQACVYNCTFRLAHLPAARWVLHWTGGFTCAHVLSAIAKPCSRLIDTQSTCIPRPQVSQLLHLQHQPAPQSQTGGAHLHPHGESMYLIGVRVGGWLSFLPSGCMHMPADTPTNAHSSPRNQRFSGTAISSPRWRASATWGWATTPPPTTTQTGC